MDQILTCKQNLEFSACFGTIEHFLARTGAIFSTRILTCQAASAYTQFTGGVMAQLQVLSKSA